MSHRRRVGFRAVFALLTGLGLLGSLPVTPAAASEVPVEMNLRQVSTHSYFVQGVAGTATDNAGFISNAGAVITAEGVVVFDALGSPALARMLLERIRAVSRQPVVKVVVSHYHADHIYGLQVFRDLGAEIIAPAGVEKYLESAQAQERLEERRLSLDPWVNDDTRLVWPDTYVEEQLKFEVGGLQFQINNLGAAHSDADLAMLVEPDGVLFSGDIIFEGRVPFVGDANTRGWLKVLTGLAQRQVQALVPGHGGLAREPDKAIALTRDYLAFLREHMGQAVEELVPFDEAYAQIDWSGFSELPAFAAANRINAYQVYLSLETEALE